MKLLSLLGWRMSLVAGALLLLTGANRLSAQTSVSNFQVTLTAPPSGSTFMSPANVPMEAVTVDTSDDVAEVVFLAMSQSIGMSPQFIINLGTVSNRVSVGAHSNLFVFTWTNAPATGTYMGTWLLRAEAIRSNAVEAFSPQVTISVQSSPVLSVDIASPTNGASFAAPANIQLIAGASDTGGSIAEVQFFDGKTSLGIVSNFAVVDPPGSPGLTPGGRAYFLTWTNAPVGTHVLTASVMDTNGQTVISLPVTITVQTNHFLSVNLASPTNGAIFAAPANIQLIADVSDLIAPPLYSGAAIADVQFFDGSNLLGVASNGVIVDPLPGFPSREWAYFLTWTNAPVGTHILTALLLDTNGQSVVSLPVTITVYSILSPVVRMTSPPNNSVYRAPVNLALVAYAHDPAGYVSNVQFFAGGKSLGFGWPVSPVAGLLGSPNFPGPPVFQTNTFGLIWSNTPAGSFALTAVATDNAGVSSTSAPVNITIQPPPPPPTNLPEIVSIVATDPIAIAGTNCWSWLGLTNASPAWSNWASPAALWRWFTNCGPKDATFAVRRSGATNSDLSVTYAIGGTASNGVDYVALPGVITVPAGQTEAMITIVPNENETNIVNKTVILSLNPSAALPPNYLPGFPFRAEALIIDSGIPRPILTGALLGDRSFLMAGEGPDGAWFRVDFTTNSLNWVPLCTNQVVNGSIDFADPDAANSPMRLYRTVPLANPASN